MPHPYPLLDLSCIVSDLVSDVRQGLAEPMARGGEHDHDILCSIHNLSLMYGGGADRLLCNARPAHETGMIRMISLYHPNHPDLMRWPVQCFLSAPQRPLLRCGRTQR